jgi:hypothetical protein
MAREQLEMGEPPQLGLPRVTVIVTCFNYARYIGDALDSVLSQTYKIFECVIVDDASTDDSVTRAEQWIGDHEDPRFRLIRNPANRGQTASFAVGLASTSGEFVAFLDADDFWFPDFLQRHLEAHLNRAFFASVSGSDMIQIDEDRKTIATICASPGVHEGRVNIEMEKLPRIDPTIASVYFPETPKLDFMFPNYRGDLWTVTSGLVFRRAMLELAMPQNPDELRICTDLYIFMFCHHFTGSLFLGSALGAYRRHRKNSFSSHAVMGNGVFPGPQAGTQHHKVVVSIMLRHLLDQYDRLTAILPTEAVRGLVLILFTWSLRDNIPVQSSRLRSVLGIQSIFRAKARAVARSFLRPLRMCF